MPKYKVEGNLIPSKDNPNEDTTNILAKNISKACLQYINSYSQLVVKSKSGK